jgi:hypothetical protein
MRLLDEKRSDVCVLQVVRVFRPFSCSGHHGPMDAKILGMKTDRIRTDVTDIVFVFIFMSGFGFEYG